MYLSLNPYSNGMKIEYNVYFDGTDMTGLNPCCNGMKIEYQHPDDAGHGSSVLILVLME